MKKNLILFITAVLTAGVVMATDATLVVSPSKLTATGTPLQGATAASATIYNGNTTASTSYYTVAVSPDTNQTTATWVSVSPTSGLSTGDYDTITFTYVTTNLTEGMYDATATITQTNAPVQVKTIPIVLKINQDENLGIAFGPGSIATHASGIAIGTRAARAVAIGENAIAIGGVVNEVSGTILIGTNRWTY